MSRQAAMPALAVLLAAVLGSILPGPVIGRVKPATLDQEQILLTPDLIPELSGARTTRLRAFAWTGTFCAIPFQIDEIDATGRYVLPEGPGGQRADGRFQGHDELLVLAGAIGRKAPGDARTLCGKPVAVAIGRAGDHHPTGWIYLSECDESWPRASVDLIQVDPGSGRTATTDYQISFRPELPFAPIGLSFLPRAGGSGQDVLHDIYVEGQVRLLGGLVRITRTLKDFRATLDAWSDGPLRSIRRAQVRARTLGESYTNPGTFSIESVLAPGQLDFDVHLATRHDISAYLNDMRMTVAWDFQRFDGMTLRFPNTGRMALVDGREDAAERQLKHDVPWIFARGPQGSFVGRMTYQSDLPVLKRLHYVDAGGGRIFLGFQLSRLQQLEKGHSRFRAEILHVPELVFEEARTLMAIRARPLTRIDPATP